MHLHPECGAFLLFVYHLLFCFIFRRIHLFSFLPSFRRLFSCPTGEFDAQNPTCLFFVLTVVVVFVDVRVGFNWWRFWDRDHETIEFLLQNDLRAQTRAAQVIINTEHTKSNSTACCVSAHSTDRQTTYLAERSSSGTYWRMCNSWSFGCGNLEIHSFDTITCDCGEVEPIGQKQPLVSVTRCAHCCLS